MLTATDLDIYAVAFVQSQIDMQCDITVSAIELHDIIKKLPSGAQIQFRTTSSRLHISCNNSNFYLLLAVEKNFPSVHESDFTCSFITPTANLHTLFSKTKFAISQEETRYNMCGVSFSVDQSTMLLTCAAVDGHRLAKMHSDLPLSVNSSIKVIIPKKTVYALLKVIEDNTQEDIKIEVSNRKIRFTYDNYIITSKLIDGIFPDYEPIIPDPNAAKISIKVDANLLSEGVNRVAVVTMFDKLRSIKFHIQGESLTLKTSSSCSSSATETIQIECNPGTADMEIGINTRYILEVLQCIKNNCIFYFTDNSSAILIKNEEHPEASYIIMPMRI